MRHYMKTYKFLLMTAVMAIVATACTQDAELPTPANDDRPLVVTASLPVQAWGVESRSDDTPIDLTLHYTASNAQEGNGLQTFNITNLTLEDNSITFTTAADSDDEDSPRLVWSQIKSGTSLYLTAEKDGLAYWAKKDDVTHGESVLFGEMGLRKSRFTVELTVNGISDLTAADFTLSLSGVQAPATTPSVTAQAWDCAEGDLISVELSNGTGDSDKLTYTADFAPQTGDQKLTISYNGTNLGEITLSNIDVDVNEGSKTANQWGAGEHITLDVTINLTQLGKPNITTVTGFKAAGGTHDFNGTVTPNP